MTDLILSRDGSTFHMERDGKRLTLQHNRVLAFIKDGQWHTLAEIALHTRDPEASVSARLRGLRKPRFGSHVIEREYVERGLFRYRLLPSENYSTEDFHCPCGEHGVCPSPAPGYCWERK